MDSTKTNRVLKLTMGDKNIDRLSALINGLAWLLAFITVVLMIACGTIIFIEYNSSAPVDQEIAIPAFVATLASYGCLMIVSIIGEWFNNR